MAFEGGNEEILGALSDIIAEDGAELASEVIMGGG